MLVVLVVGAAIAVGRDDRHPRPEAAIREVCAREEARRALIGPPTWAIPAPSRRPVPGGVLFMACENPDQSFRLFARGCVERIEKRLPRRYQRSVFDIARGRRVPSEYLLTSVEVLRLANEPAPGCWWLSPSPGVLF